MDLASLTVAELREGYQRGAFVPVDVIQHVVQGIEESEHLVNAFALVRAEEALDEARSIERAARAGDQQRKLIGVPVTIKDMAATAGIRTTFGSKAFADHVPDADTPMVQRLRQAGAIIVGKTTTPEFGFVGATQSPLLGVSRNPWDLSANPGGSSGGAAIAAALGLGPLHTGGDGAGSIRIPASLCGVFGLKPSIGLTPQVPMGSIGTLGVHGPLARSVRDAAVMMDVISGPDLRDLFAYAPVDDYSAACDRHIDDVRVGWSPTLGYARVDPEVLEVVLGALSTLEDVGCKVEPTDLTLDDPYGAIVSEFYGGISRRYGSVVLADEAAATPALLRVVREVGPDADMSQGLEVKADLITRLASLFGAYDVLATPTLPIASFPAGVEAPAPTERAVDMLRWTSFTYPVNLAGLPAASVPVGFTRDGHPVGMQLIGRRGADGQLLAMATRLEEAIGWRSWQPTLAEAP